jgi:uncharacterized protein (TIGR00369 family)
VEELDPIAMFGPDQGCFGCAPHNPVGMRLRFFRDLEAGVVVTKLTPQPGWEGPPGVLHGGLQATLADEIGAWTLVGLRKRFGLTTSLQLRFLRPARTDREIEARGEIAEEDERQVVVRVELTQGDHRLLVGTATYVVPTVRIAERLLGRPLPEAWKALAR